MLLSTPSLYSFWIKDKWNGNMEEYVENVFRGLLVVWKAKLKWDLSNALRLSLGGGQPECHPGKPQNSTIQGYSRHWIQPQHMAEWKRKSQLQNYVFFYSMKNLMFTISLLLIAVSHFLSLSNVLTYKLSLKKMNFIFQNVQLITWTSTNKDCVNKHNSV